MVFAVGCYVLWGLFPAYFPLLKPADGLEILAHRILWSAVVMVVVLTVTRGWAPLRAASARMWGLMALSGLLVSGNWLIYVLAINGGHVAEAALGYFINPLVSVVLGIVFLKEQLRRGQLIAVGIAGVAVGWLTIAGGAPPIIGLGLALTFGLYGLLKKRIDVPATAGLAAETLCMAPVAVVWLAVTTATGAATWHTHGAGHAALLLSSGVVTVVPLLLFAYGAKAIPLATIGMLQYLTPTLQMLWAVFVVHETITTQRWVGFVLIWIAVGVFLADTLRAAHHTRRHQHPHPAQPLDAA